MDGTVDNVEEPLLVRTLLADTERELAEIMLLPQEQRLPKLTLLALEREQIAAVAYSEDLVADRIQTLPVSEECRELVSRVVKWTHRDEALHSQYMRGVLLQSLPEMSGWQRLLPTASIVSRQIVGSISGWVTAVSHHHSSEAWGLRSFVSRSAIALGRVAGRIPDGLQDELSYHGFRRFCLLNVALEKTAVLSYERTIELLSDPDAIDAFSRILADERRHARVFAVLADAFDDTDQLREGMTFEQLTERVGEISPWFLPARSRATNHTTFGRGSLVHVERGDHGQLVQSFEAAVEAGGLEALVRSNPGPVAVRCHFMLGYHRDDLSNVVHPEAMEALARQLRSWGATDVALVETPMAYDRFFGNRSVAEVAEYFGFTSPLYRIVDVSEDARDVSFERGLVSTKVSATWADASLRVVLSKLRGDPEEIAHLSLASFCGIGTRTDDHLYTDKLVDHRTAALMVLDIAPPDFAIVDAWAPVADGPLGVMGCHQPSDVRRFYAGADAFSVDAAVFADMGFPDPNASELVRQADQWFGAESRPVDVVGQPGPLEGFRAPHRNLWYRFISASAAPIYFHLSGRGRLFVPEMDTEAFPPIDDPGWFVRMVRWGSQQLFGLHPPRDSEPLDRSITKPVDRP